jgi:hypothetical protein
MLGPSFSDQPIMQVIVNHHYIYIYHYTSSAIDGFIQTWNQLNDASDPPANQPQPALMVVAMKSPVALC